LGRSFGVTGSILLTMAQQRTATEDQVLPYRHWWGLLGCAALMGVIFAAGPYSEGLVLEPDRGDMWYFWQLAEPTAITRLAAWVPFSLHWIAMWVLIARGRSERPTDVFGLHSFNLQAIAVNAFFILLHIAQTRVFYDGLAQDTHEATSLGSVVIMLFAIMLMENRRRGLVFGHKFKFMFEAGDTVRRYHGYYFSWAIIYTFWYHPVELTQGHLAGFAYMFLLFLQGSLFFTRYHTNRWWTMSLELLFVVHGAFVAYFIMQKGQNGPWAMFFFGGVTLFLITQMHGLGLSRKGKLAIALPLLAVMAGFYALFPEGLGLLPRVPLINYIGTILVLIVVWLLLRFGGLVKWLQAKSVSA
jgi:hypothetical protein